MNINCQHCQRCYDHKEVANAHTVVEKSKSPVSFSSLDDTVGIDICQVCHKPPLLARLWHKLDKNKFVVPEIIQHKENSHLPEMAVSV
ncbi:hypothetical protein [Runella sp.]|uniref:hypothetical protein n=1 Tax=Runella sp. TaxID=1960881 RepID=UPI003D0BB9DA